MQTDTLEATVPQDRLLSAMTDVRKKAHKSRRQLAQSSNGRCTARNLRQFETGQLPVDSTTLLELTSIYQTQAMEALTPRHNLEISLEVGTIHVGGRKHVFEADTASREDVIGSFLALVYAGCDAKEAAEIVIPESDLSMLAQAIEMPVDLLQARICELIEVGIPQITVSSSVRYKIFMGLAIGVMSASAVFAAFSLMPKVFNISVDPMREATPSAFVAFKTSVNSLGPNAVPASQLSSTVSVPSTSPSTPVVRRTRPQSVSPTTASPVTSPTTTAPTFADPANVQVNPADGSSGGTQIGN